VRTWSNYLGAPLAESEGRVAFVSNDNFDGHSNATVLLSSPGVEGTTVAPMAVAVSAISVSL